METIKSGGWGRQKCFLLLCGRRELKVLSLAVIFYPNLLSLPAVQALYGGSESSQQNSSEDTPLPFSSALLLPTG